MGQVTPAVLKTRGGNEPCVGVDHSEFYKTIAHIVVNNEVLNQGLGGTLLTGVPL